MTTPFFVRTFSATRPAIRVAATALAKRHGTHGATVCARAWKRPNTFRPSSASGRASHLYPFHFRNSAATRTASAVNHQHYIERDVACVASLGTIGSSLEDRAALWRANGEAAVYRRGWIELGPDSPAAITAALLACGSAEPDPATGKLRYWAPDDDAYRHARDAVRDAAGFRVAGAPAPPSQEPMPPGTAARKPRAPNIQLRIVASLPYELTLRQNEELLTQWCDLNLGAQGSAYDAVIHRPEANNDIRNWHSHVVFQPYLADRAGDGRWAIARGSRGAPVPTPIARALRGNSGSRAQGRSDTLRRFRHGWASAVNTALEAEGYAKRYDPRTNEEAGLPAARSSHRPVSEYGDYRTQTARSRAPTADTWHEAPATDAADGVRLLSGLSAYGYDQGNALWDDSVRQLGIHDHRSRGAATIEPAQTAAAPAAVDHAAATPDAVLSEHLSYWRHVENDRMERIRNAGARCAAKPTRHCCKRTHPSSPCRRSAARHRRACLPSATTTTPKSFCRMWPLSTRCAHPGGYAGGWPDAGEPTTPNPSGRPVTPSSAWP